MGGCSALNCSNKFPKYRLFTFPTCLKRRAQWARNMCRDNWIPRTTCRLCEKHFEESQFEQNRQDGWKKLKWNAVPTLFNVSIPPALNTPLPQRSLFKKVSRLKKNTQTTSENTVHSKSHTFLNAHPSSDKEGTKQKGFDMETCVDVPPQEDALSESVSNGQVCTSFGEQDTVKGESYMEEKPSCNLDIDEREPSPMLMNIKEEPKDEEEGEMLQPIDFVSVSMIKEEYDEQIKEEVEEEEKLEPFDFVSVGEEQEEEILGYDGPVMESGEECVLGDENEIPVNPEVSLGQKTTMCDSTLDLSYTPSTSVSDEERIFKCEVCPSSFKKQWNLKQHMLKHSGTKPYACDECGKAYSDSSVLKKHKRIHSGEKPYACNVCEKRFIQKCSLKKHLTFHKEKPFPCDLCNRSFASASKMEYHRRVHTEDKPFKCQVCGAEFRQSHNLSKHKHIHSNEKPYKCEDCHKSFSQLYNLKTHRQVHTGEKPFKCGYCDAAFRVKEKLIIHERKHTGERPYPCDICDKAFSILTSYKVHMRAHANGTR